MLLRIAVGQARFNVPGLAQDARGVALGGRALLLFPSIERLIAFFRVHGESASLDDLLPTLSLQSLRSAVGTLEIACQFASGSSYLMDAVARVARVVGGLAYTGAGKHFVRYRDAAAPLGYDCAELATEPGDFILYDEERIQSYGRLRDLSFERLLLTLDLVPGPRLEEEALTECYLTIPLGLGRALLGHLRRHGIDAQAGVCELAGGGAVRELLLIHARDLPARRVRLFEGLPGVHLFVPVLDNVAVELHHAHPLQVGSCERAFPRDRLFLLTARHEERLTFAAAPALVAIDRLLDLARVPDAESIETDLASAPISVRAPAPLTVSFRLGPSIASPRGVIGSLVPWAQAASLKRLVFLLPPQLLAGLRLALLEPCILIVGTRGLDPLPLGELLSEIAPSVLVPLGMDLVPRARPEVIAALVGASPLRRVVFPGPAFAEGLPFAIADDALVPLDRRMVAGLEVAEARIEERAQVQPLEPAPEVVNDDLPLFSFWGTRRARGPAGRTPGT